jgi:rhamnogalacturonan endolyase
MHQLKHHLKLKTMLAGCALFALSAAPLQALAAFGLTTNTGDYTIDTGAGLVFKVLRTATSQAGVGDISSLVYNGVELQGQTKGSHIASGFSGLYTGVTAVSVSATQPDTDTIKVTVTTGNLTHYYMARRNVSHIYMGTNITAEPSVGEFRWITRMKSSILTGVPAESNLNGTTTTVESTDVFGFANGETRSKYYGNQRTLDYTLRGITGSGVGVYMVYDNREGASGGPFFRDIQNQSSSTTSGDTELYNYMNSGHNQTEAYRMGFHGPYALLFTGGSTPAIPDMSWVANMGLTGYVAASGRGGVTVAGMTGLDSSYPYTVAFSNSTAQYWGAANASSGQMTKTGMKPGTYTMTVYKNELAVDSRSVTVSAGSTTNVSSFAVTGDPAAKTALWRIGKWDGSPKEFLNGDKVNAMHPSDTRMAYWTPADYIVGTSSAATGFPAYQWKGVNGAVNVRFNLTAAQVVASSTYQLRVGITAAYSNARPQVTVNGWTSAVPTASTQPDSRSLTIGTYRGNNAMFTFAVPVANLVVGQNILTLAPASGSSGTTYLSPGYAFDAVDLIKTP